MSKWFKRTGLALLVLLVLVFAAAWWQLRGSLPRMDGELALHGLSAPVTIQRDKLGIVTIDAANETDAMRALGYVHAQERFFEMDLMRRTAAGELAELFGSIAVDTDKRHRIHRFRARVEKNIAAVAGDKLPQLRAYTEGVNAGLRDLRAEPWPYLLLRQDPQPWRLADSALTGYAMFFDLQGEDNGDEYAMWKISAHVPPALLRLLQNPGSTWDAPLMGEARGDAVLPGAGELNLRTLPMPAQARDLKLISKPENGSNNFAVSGALTRDGRAIVADDMHLGLRAPNIWFRARLRYADARAPGGKVDLTGFTLPGLPAVVVGSNGHVAWAFTNSYGDWMDWVRLCPTAPQGPEPACPSPYMPETVATIEETIRVAGADPVPFEVRETRAGPIMHDLKDGTSLALRWSAHLPGSLNFGLAGMATAADAAQAAASASGFGIPGQNFVVADRAGHIEWTIAGRIPERRPSCLPDRPQASTPPSDPPLPGWVPGPHDPCEMPWWKWRAANPSIPAPHDGRLWTANARVVDGQALAELGDGGYALGARAKQIRDGLFAKRVFTERDLLAIQLDDRALFLERWWRLLREQSQHAESPSLQALANAASAWQGRASADSVSYRIVRAWRLAVNARIADGLTAPAQAALGDDFDMPGLSQLEGVAWPLVTQRPAHLLPRRFASWDALFEDAAAEVAGEFSKKGPLAERTWGERNTAAICHPLAKAIPLIGKRVLCMPPDRLDGDTAMPRVAGPAFGASERMVVSPGHEADGIVHMPGGQAGNPLSPFWGAGHEDWVHGRPTPFLPGEAEYTLKLEPAR